MAKQIYIDSNGNEVLVSGTITTDNNLPHYTGTPTAGTTAYEIANYMITDVANGTIGSIGANNYADPVYNITAHTGYKAIGIIGLYIGNLACVSGGYYLQDSGTKVKVIVRNVTATALTNVDITAVILYKKE